jgi:hypothetical protein
MGIKFSFIGSPWQPYELGRGTWGAMTGIAKPVHFGEDLGSYTPTSIAIQCSLITRPPSGQPSMLGCPTWRFGGSLAS